MAVVVATSIIALAPLIISGVRGESLPEGLVNITDKSVAGLLTLLGTIGGLLFRQSRADEQRVDNTTAAFEAIKTAQASTPGDSGTIRDGDSVTMEKQA